MIESGYYPPGAEFDSRAPYNAPNIPEQSFDVCISQTLSKNTKVTTDDYVPREDGDEDGNYMVADTSDTNWKEAYDKYHYTPLQLIGEFKSLLEKHLPDPIIDPKGFRRAKNLISECEGWVEDDIEVMEE